MYLGGNVLCRTIITKKYLSIGTIISKYSFEHRHSRVKQVVTSGCKGLVQHSPNLFIYLFTLIPQWPQRAFYYLRWISYGGYYIIALLGKRYL